MPTSHPPLIHLSPTRTQLPPTSHPPLTASRPPPTHLSPSDVNRAFLPPKHEYVVFCVPDPLQARIYHKLTMSSKFKVAATSTSF